MPPLDAPPPPAAPSAAPQPVPPIPPLDVAGIVAEELKLPPASVVRTLELIAGGATVPFMARYRKEVTGGLDEVQLGAIKQRAEELAELDSRRKTVIESIAGQGKLTDPLLGRLLSTRSRTELEDLYLPYKPKRRTRAMIARERGLEPLADILWAQAPSLQGSREPWPRRSCPRRRRSPTPRRPGRAPGTSSPSASPTAPTPGQGCGRRCWPTGSCAASRLVKAMNPND
jgi:hypothetical protein